MLGIEGAKEGRLLYHLTHVDNFRSIVQEGLLSRREVYKKGLRYKDVADMEIIGKRECLGLDCYTPFHFHPYSAFDVAVKRANDAQRMMYICVYRNYAREHGYKILPMHPLSMEDWKIYDYDDGFAKIDWETLTRKNDYSDYAKEVKMAECLSDRGVCIDEFASVFVANQKIKKEIELLLVEEEVPKSMWPQIFVQPIWFSDYGSAF